jgi:hypothetical protein
MTKNEAIELMKQGKKLTHKYFGTEEWVSMGNDGQMILEDGVECTPEEFWYWRKYSYWDKDWSIFNCV